MQYKMLLCLLGSSCLGFTASQAQQYQDFTITPKSSKIIVTDAGVEKPSANQVILDDIEPVPKKAAETKQETAKLKKAPPVDSTVLSVSSSHKYIPLAGHTQYFGTMNDYVVNYTRNYMRNNKKHVAVVKSRGEKTFDLIDKVMEEHDLPKELKYLAVIESALNNKARSRVGAVGAWQFMAPTARLMGLTVNNRRDDRKDWEKSTHAAAKYLNYLYGELNDWLLVIAAYNSGPRPIYRAMQRTGSKSFWDIKSYLPKETQGHVMAFIATASIFENMNLNNWEELPSDYDFKYFAQNGSKDPAAKQHPAKGTPAKKANPFTEEELKNMAIVRIKEPLLLDLLVADLKMDQKVLEKWNPDYKDFEHNADGESFYSLRIPKDKLNQFISRKEYLSKQSKNYYAENNIGRTPDKKIVQ